MVIEKAAGRSYHDELKERFLKPLRLDKTEPAIGRHFSGLAAGYISDDNPLWLGRDEGR